MDANSKPTEKDITSTLDELTASVEWKVLDPSLKSLLRDALTSRDLVGVISKQLGVNRDTALQVAIGLLNDSDVLPLIVRHATGINLKPEASKAEAAAAVGN